VTAERFLRQVVVISIPERSGIETNQSQQPKMIRSLASIAIFALLGFAAIALPSFAPAVQASEAAVLLKGDRLATRVANSSCTNQVWPDFTPSCLRNSFAGAIPEARLVTSRR
jgi:hypothetical protein